MEVAGGREAGSQPGMWQGHVLGASAFRRSTAGLPLGLPGAPCATDGDYMIQLVDGKAGRAIPAGAEARALHEALPAGRGGMLAFNRGGGTGLAVRARRPVRARTAGGREEIVYKASEMEEGRPYAVEWNGGRYALRKSGGSVEIFRFRADGGGGPDGGRGGPREGGV